MGEEGDRGWEKEAGSYRRPTRAWFTLPCWVLISSLIGHAGAPVSAELSIIYLCAPAFRTRIFVIKSHTCSAGVEIVLRESLDIDAEGWGSGF